MMDSVVERAALGLGAGAGVVAELYKLLIYDEGSFFVSHRDTEKSAGMFATLIIALPSLHSGGELSVRHRERGVQLDLRGADFSELAWAAFTPTACTGVARHIRMPVGPRLHLRGRQRPAAQTAFVRSGETAA